VNGLYTVGFAGKTLEEFIALLKGVAADRVIDIRLRPSSQLSGFARQPDLRFVLEHYEGIEYRHEPELAPTPEILDEYRKSKDWGHYERRFHGLMLERDVASKVAAAVEDAVVPVLLCSEPTPEKCHRRLIAEHYAESEGCREVRHL
jgi:uncharacterized protein (DUF488 family)